MTFFVSSFLILLSLFTAWWFWFFKPKTLSVMQTGSVDLTIENGVYKPSVIRAVIHKPITLNLTLKDDAHCAKTIIFSDFEQSAELTKNKMQTLTIIPEKLGEFEFSCPMGMYRGKLIVEKTPSVDVIIEGGVYVPDFIPAKVGEAITLNFIRKDNSHCAAMVIFPDLDISEEIPINGAKEITITPTKSGELPFSCSMGMYKGALIVT